MHREKSLVLPGASRASQADQVEFDLCVAVFAGPEVEWRGVDFINQRYGESKTREVNCFDVMLAGVARFDADVIEFG